LNNTLQIKSLTIIGAGSWATALCKIFSESGIEVRWWFHRKEDAEHFSSFHQNPRYLTDVDFKGRNISVFSDLKSAIDGSDSILIAVPSAFVAQVLQNISIEDLAGKKIISSIKGILPIDLQLVTDYLAEKFHVNPFDMAVVGGPCHAEEVALEKQSYLTVAANDESLAKHLKALMQSRYISVKTSNDPDGLEWAAVLKNVYAIACGVCHGLGYGDNFQAVLVANAMQEMNLFLKHCAPKERDPLASAYLGDLLVTAYSTFSRNRTFGNMVGRGYGIKAAQVELGMIAEGYYAIEGLFKMKEKFGIQLPIADAMYAIMYQNEKVKEVVGKLKAILT
jgi:glycerol-3-phosphate dehydrogenase (NAD(P)+)